MEKDNEYLVDIKLNRGDIDKVVFESKEQKTDFINKYGLNDLYQQARNYKIEAYYTNNPEEKNNFSVLLENKNENISKVVDGILKERGINTPTLLNNEEKINTIIDELKGIGISDQEIDNLLKNGIGKTGKNEEEVVLTFSNTADIKQTLTSHDIQYSETNDGLKVNAKMLLKEGFEVDNTPKNRKLLEENDVTYFLKAAEDERKIFIPLRAKKVAILIAASLILGPVPALALQIALNQTKLNNNRILDMLLDKHLISPNQKTALKNGMTIKATQRENGKDVEQFLYKDSFTGKINRVNVRDVNIPSQVYGVKLTPSQVENLKNGKTIDVVDKNGIAMAFRIDMNSENGIKAFYKEMKSDREFMNVPKPESPDIDKLKYIGLKGAQGINDIYRGNGANIKRDSFLTKFDLKKDFHEFSSLQKDLKIAEISGNITNTMVKSIAEKSEKVKDLALDLVIGENVSRKR